MNSSQPAASAYHSNQLLSLNIASSHGFLKAHSKIRLRITKLQQPWTLSCGIVAVILDGVEDEATVFLKLFDRRWANQLRSDNGIQPWTTNAEESYARSAQSGRVASFLDKLIHEDDFRDTQDSWDDAENEAFLSQELMSLYTAETTAYETLQKYQGKTVPRLLAKVTLDLMPPKALAPSDIPEHMQIKGILLQYLPGFSLSALDQHVPRLAWQGVIDEAVRITRMLGDLNLLNSDVRPDNFIIVPANNEYRVFMIDFGQCRLRRVHESDKDWGQAKWQQDEEGAVGMVMRQRLRKIGFEYKFEPSMRYFEWAPGEDDD